MGYEERMWDRLIEYLGELGSAREVEAGRIEVTTTEGDPRTLQILMTSAEFATWVSTINGSFWLTAKDVRTQLLDAPAECPYLVFDSYELVPSPTEELPPDRDE